jgi:hypothetical protein
MAGLFRGRKKKRITEQPITIFSLRKDLAGGYKLHSRLKNTRDQTIHKDEGHTHPSWSTATNQIHSNAGLNEN